MKPKLFNGTEWIEFENEKEHDEYIANHSPNPEFIIPPAKQRREIGESVIDAYMDDVAPIKMSIEQAQAQMKKFETIISFLKIGNLSGAKLLLQQADADEFFTEERKQKYISMLTI